MSTKKDKGKLLGTQSAHSKLRFDATPIKNYEAKDKAEKQAKTNHTYSVETK